jgi:hypothetical protein
MFAHEIAGAARTRSSLRPHFFWANEFAKLGRMLSRERGNISTIMPAQAGIQYSETLVMEPKTRGVLDTRRSLSSGSPKARPGGGYDDVLAV